MRTLKVHAGREGVAKQFVLWHSNCDQIGRSTEECIREYKDQA